MPQTADIALIGLAVMGQNIVLNMNDHGYVVAVFNRTVSKVDEFLSQEAKGTRVVGAHSLEELVGLLKKPRRIMLLVKAGAPVDEFINHLVPLLEPGDIIIDGGNSLYKDDIKRTKKLAEKQIHYVDCGTSGGTWGIERGYCLMIGGPTEAVKHLDPIFAALAPGAGNIQRTPGREKRDPRAELGYIHAGPSGAGHLVKMVHNGIE